MSDGQTMLANGMRLAEQLFGHPLGDVASLPLDTNDDLPKELVAWLYGYLLTERTRLTLQQKLLCLIAMCTVRAQKDMLERWIPAARSAGCTREQVRETMITMLVYGGWPATRIGLETLAQVWPQQPEETPR